MSTWMSPRQLFGFLIGVPRPGRMRGRSQFDSQGPKVVDVIPVETLEERSLPSALTILIDYRYDTNNFFDTQQKRDLLQSAADAYAARIVDDLAAIQAGGHNSWSAEFTNPGTGQTIRVDNLYVPTDTIIVFAGGRDLDDYTLAIAGPGGYSATGSHSWLATVGSRGQSGAERDVPSDFGPWGGSITFDTSGTAWHFGETTDGLGWSEADFLSVATHELAHIFGFGTSPSFDALVSNGRFVGTTATAVYDGTGSPLLDADDSHWNDGLSDDGYEVAMDPTISLGSRKLMTELDWAALDDIGWTLTTSSSVPTPTVTFDGGIPNYLRKGTRASFGGGASFGNSGSLSLAGSSLQVKIIQNRGRYDVVTIAEGNGITKSGNKLKYNGVVIGSYSNGRDGRAFKLNFNANATDAAVQACLQNLQFYTTTRSAGIMDRLVSIRLLDVDGLNTAPDLKTIRVA